MITIKSQHEIDLMREAGRIVAETHQLLKESLRPGMSTLELDEIAERYIRSKGAIPSFKNFSLIFPSAIIFIFILKIILRNFLYKLRRSL